MKLAITGQNGFIGFHLYNTIKIKCPEIEIINSAGLNSQSNLAQIGCRLLLLVLQQIRMPGQGSITINSLVKPDLAKFQAILEPIIPPPIIAILLTKLLCQLWYERRGKYLSRTTKN